MRGERVAQCGQKAGLGDQSRVSLHQHGESAHFGGIETCGSVWMCPVCAAKITEGRKSDLDILLRRHRETGGIAFMATLTIPHYRFQSCKALKEGVATAWRKTKSGKAWQRARAAHGWLGDVRALEVTHGSNGWHPHLHVLILFNPKADKNTAYSFGGWLFDAWSKAVERLGFGQCSAGAFRYEPVNADTGAAEYVGKWGASTELTKAHTKTAKHGGRTPWQILREFSEHRKHEDRALFREYAYAFKGARQLTWSRGLKALYGIDEVSDDELAEEPQIAETHTASLSGPLFRLVSKRGLTAHVLNAHEQNGPRAVVDLLIGFDIAVSLGSIPSLEPGRYVPLISLSAEIRASATSPSVPRRHPPSGECPDPKRRKSILRATKGTTK